MDIWVLAFLVAIMNNTMSIHVQVFCVPLSLIQPHREGLGQALGAPEAANLALLVSERPASFHFVPHVPYVRYSNTH